MKKAENLNLQHRSLMSHALNDQEQQGAVLLIVLFVMLLMASASLIALRSTRTSLDLTTTFQVNQLLFQASDAPLRQLENLAQDKKQLRLLIAESGPFGYLAKEEADSVLTEYTVCYQPKLYSAIYSASTAKIMTAGKALINPKGYCNLADNNTNNFVSDRKLIATQLTFVRLNAAGQHAFEQLQSENIAKAHTRTPFSSPSGQDLKRNKQTHIRVYVTSVMPSFSKASLGSIDSCLAKPITTMTSASSLLGKAENQLICLKRTATPFNVQVQDYVFSLKAVPSL